MGIGIDGADHVMWIDNGVTPEFTFASAEPLNLPEDIPMLSLCDVGFSYDSSQKPIFDKLDLSIAESSRLAITGKNGAGKTTLVKLITGDLDPIDGEILRHHNLRIAYFGQHDAEML